MTRGALADRVASFCIDRFLHKNWEKNDRTANG
jgi:hypothetical protein